MKLLISACFLLCVYAFNTGPSPSFVALFTDQPATIHIKSTLNKAQCNNKDYIPIDLPKNSKGIIYSVSAVKKLAFSSAQNVLLKEVKLLAEKHDPSEISDYIVPQGVNDDFNFYIISGDDNMQGFNNCGHFVYQEKFVDTKSRAGYLNTADLGPGTIYLGIENNNDLRNLRVVIEVVAIVYE